MKFISTLLIAFCSFQVLICSTFKLNENSVREAAEKTLKYVKLYHQDSIKLKDKDSLIDLKFNYPALAMNNILIKVDEFGVLSIKYANIKATLTGKYSYFFQFWKADVDFTAQLNNVNWEVTYLTSIYEIGNEKIDIKLKKNSESQLNYNIGKLTTIKIRGDDHDKVMKEINITLKKVDFTPLQNEFSKLTQLILDTLKSDPK